MKITTIHQKVIVDSTMYEFGPTDDPQVFIGEVPDDVGQRLLGIKRTPNEYVQIHEPAPIVESAADDDEPKRGKKK